MKKSSILITVVLITVLIFAGCKRETEEVVNSTKVENYIEQEQVINVGVNEEFTILEHNYIWTNYDETLLKLVDSRDVQLDYPLLYDKSFTFKTLAIGKTEIIMKSLPALELPDKVYTINIK